MKNRILTFATVSLGLLGCQLLLATDRTQCATDADCAAQSSAPLVCRDTVCVAAVAPPTPDAGDEAGVDLTSPWGCLADPPSRAREDRSQLVTVRQRFHSYSLFDCQHHRPVAGAEVKLCSQRDVSCGSPVESAMTDCNGDVTFNASYRGFEGYMMIMPPSQITNDAGASDWNPVTKKCYEDLFDKEAAEERSGERCAIEKDETGQVIVPLPDDLVPGIVAIVPPPSVSGDPNVAPETKAILSSRTLKSLLAVVGKPFDERAGHLNALGVNCQNKPSPGVALTVTGGIGPDSQIFYTDAQALPNVNQGETSEDGATGYLNLDPSAGGVNVISVTATRPATGERIGVYAALIRSGYVTYLKMAPLKN